MPTRLIVLLAAITLFLCISVASAIGGVFWRRKLIHLLKDRHPAIWARIVASPDVSTPIGTPMTSSSRMVRLLRDENSASDDPEVLSVARSLRRANITLIGCVLLIVALLLASRLKLL